MDLIAVSQFDRIQDILIEGDITEVEGWSTKSDRNLSAYVWPLSGKQSQFISKARLPVSEEPFPVVFFVISAPDNFDRRQSLRSTWVVRAKRLDCPVIFLLGK